MAHFIPLPNIQEALARLQYPATADDIVSRAESNKAARQTLKLLARLPDRTYRNSSEINHALGKIEEMPDTGQRFWAKELEDLAPFKRR